MHSNSVIFSSQRDGALALMPNGLRGLSAEEIAHVSGGSAVGDTLGCLGGIAATIGSEGLAAIGTGAATLGACMSAVGDIAGPTAADANCAPGNACTDGSVDGTDGNGSPGGDGGGGGDGDGGGD